jgi:hypothetical protein
MGPTRFRRFVRPFRTGSRPSRIESKLFGVCLCIVAGCQAPKVSAVEDQNVSSSVGTAIADISSPPLIFQPEFVWRRARTTRQGTGFFVRYQGQQFALSSSHYLFSEANDWPLSMNAIDFFNQAEGKWLATSRQTIGPIGANLAVALGQGPTDDVAIYSLSSPAENVHEFALSAKETIPAATPIWMPVPDFEAGQGYRRITGKVRSATQQEITVVLDHPLTITSQSGSPVVDQSTAEVIGIFSSFSTTPKGELLVHLTPSTAILAALREERTDQPIALPYGYRPISMARELAGHPSKFEVVEQPKTKRSKGWMTSRQFATLFNMTISTGGASADQRAFLAMKTLGHQTSEQRLPRITSKFLRDLPTSTQLAKDVVSWFDKVEKDANFFCKDVKKVFSEVENENLQTACKTFFDRCNLANCRLVDANNAVDFCPERNAVGALIACTVHRQLQKSGGSHPVEDLLLQAMFGGFEALDELEESLSRL